MSLMLRLSWSLLLFIWMCPLAAQCQPSRGQLKDAKPTGVWEYFDDKDLALRYDYDSSHVQFIQPDTVRYPVLVDSTWQVYRLDRAPRLLGSHSEMMTTVIKQLRYPFQDRRAQVSGTVILAYTIDQEGRRTNPVATTTPSVTLAEEVFRAVEAVPMTYLPAIYKGKYAPVKISFVVRFCLCKTLKECQISSNYQAKTVPMPLGSAGEIIVTSGY